MLRGKNHKLFYLKYLKKENYFEKQYRRKYDENKVVIDMPL